MKASLEKKLTGVCERHEELAALMADSDIAANAERFANLSREYSELQPVVTTFTRWQEASARLADSESLTSDEDPEMRVLAQEDADQCRSEVEALLADLEALLMPRDPDDKAPAFLEIRAGTGGDEAALFAGDLLRMYTRYAEQRAWSLELLSERPGELGGYREVVARIAGDGVYGRLKFESGAHRVQRVPVTESSGRIHTSACTVAVMPEPEDVAAIELAREDLRIDTFRASGAGGQHVNKTDSAVRITHLPSGLVVECQDERSQHKNRARAMALLQARLNDAAKQRAGDARALTRRNLVGSGDRSERIRTYNYAQGRVTDHRIDLTLYSLDAILEGEVDAVIEPLIREHQADLLAVESQGRSDMQLADILAAARARGLDRLDAELLAAEVLGVNRSSVIAHPERQLDSEEAARLIRLHARREAGEPFALLVGRQAFHALELEVEAGVLIPRADTETLVDAVLERVDAIRTRVLDLGCGSGAIALALATARPDWLLTAVDRDPAALALSRRNAHRLGVSARVEVIESDWYQALGDQRWPVIVSNPPYVAEQDDDLAPDVRAHEPAHALFSGDDGLDAIRSILRAPPLTSGGLIAIEHGHRQGEAVRTLMAQAQLEAVATLRDLGGRERVTLGRARETDHG